MLRVLIIFNLGINMTIERAVQSPVCDLSNCPETNKTSSCIEQDFALSILQSW